MTALTLELVDLLELSLRPGHRRLRRVALRDLREHVDDDVLRARFRGGRARRGRVAVPLRERPDLLEEVELWIAGGPELALALLVRRERVALARLHEAA